MQPSSLELIDKRVFLLSTSNIQWGQEGTVFDEITIFPQWPKASAMVLQNQYIFRTLEHVNIALHIHFGKLN